jgi:hypothetical protein
LAILTIDPPIRVPPEEESLEMRGYQLPFAKFLCRAVPLAALALWAAACSPGSKVPADVANVPTCSVPPDTVKGWFKSGSIKLDGEVTPADSIAFTDNPNCDFYVWTERMFLWLTSPAPASYGGGGRIFASPAFFDVSPEGPGHVRTLIAHKVGPRLDRCHPLPPNRHPPPNRRHRRAA